MEQVIYIKADFSAHRIGDARPGPNPARRYFASEFINVQLIHVQQVLPFRRNEKRLGDNYLELPPLKEVSATMAMDGDGTEHTFQLDIPDGILRDPVEIESGMSNQHKVSLVTGTLYATLRRHLPDPVSAETSTIPAPGVTRTRTVSASTPAAPRPTESHTGTSGFNFTNWISGCLSFLLYIPLILLVLSLLIQGLAFLGGFFKIILALLGIGLLIYLLRGLLRKLSGIIPFLLSFLLILAVLSYLFSSSGQRREGERKRQPAPQEDSAETDVIKKDTVRVKTDTARQKVNPLLMVHHRIWDDYAPTRYEGDLEVYQSDFFASRTYREGINPSARDEYGFWNTLYGAMAKHDDASMQLVYSLFDSLRRVNQLNPVRFADAIVSCVQDIPYCLIIDKKEELTGWALQYYREHGALEHIRYGVQAPTEFMYNLQGDCDTRSLLCYTILTHYGYNAAIFVSARYSHSVLGLALPCSGSSITYRGVRYYAWETTAPDFQLGQLSNQYNNMDYWEVVLTSN